MLAPISNLSTGMIFELTQRGANVVLASSSNDRAESIAAEVESQREIDSDRGHFHPLTLNGSSTSGKEILSQAVQAIGGIDIFIDADVNSETGFTRQTATEISLLLLDAFKTRHNGRVIFLLPKPFSGLDREILVQTAERRSLQFLAEDLAAEAVQSKSTFNSLVIGLTEEFLLRISAKSSANANPSPNEALKKLQENHPGAKMCDVVRISELVAFLSTNAGAGVSGQTIDVSRH